MAIVEQPSDTAERIAFGRELFAKTPDAELKPHDKTCFCDECIDKNRRQVESLQSMIDSGNYRQVEHTSGNGCQEPEQERNAKDGAFLSASAVIDAEYTRVPPVMLVSEMTHGRDRETIVLVWEVGNHHTAIDGLIAASQRTGTMLTIPGMQEIVAGMATAEYRHKKRHGLL